MGGTPEPPLLPQPAVPPREGKREGRREVPFPPKFVSELGWSAAGAGRAPLSGSGSEVPGPFPALRARRRSVGTRGRPSSPGSVRGRGKPSPRKPLLTGPDSLHCPTSDSPPRSHPVLVAETAPHGLGAAEGRRKGDAAWLKCQHRGKEKSLITIF